MRAHPEAPPPSAVYAPVHCAAGPLVPMNGRRGSGPGTTGASRLEPFFRQRVLLLITLGDEQAASRLGPIAQGEPARRGRGGQGEPAGPPDPESRRPGSPPPCQPPGGEDVRGGA